MKESRATLACLYRTSGRFYMLQLISVDSRHFTRPELSLGWSDLHEIKSDKICISVGTVKVTQVGHFDILTLAFPFITIAHHPPELQVS